MQVTEEAEFARAVACKENVAVEDGDCDRARNLESD